MLVSFEYISSFIQCFVLGKSRKARIMVFYYVHGRNENMNNFFFWRIMIGYAQVSHIFVSGRHTATICTITEILEAMAFSC